MTKIIIFVTIELMGKHERDWVEVAERAVADGLNGIPQDEYISPIVEAIRNRIGTEYLKSNWVGGDNYRDPGDVHVLWPNRVDRIELKFSKGAGSGTAKNVSSRILTKKVENSILGYQQWDQLQGFKDRRYALVESRIQRELKSASDYCNQLRKFRYDNDSIVEQIAEITAPGQESYAEYAADECNRYLDRVNNLVHEILGTSDIDQQHQDVIYCVIKKFGTKDQTVEFFDFTDFDKSITEVVASGKSIKFLNRNKKDVIRFSVTWKNICQGGATPCFNVFVGNAFRH